MVANSDNYMGMGTGNYLPQNYNVGPAPVAPMGKGGNPAIPYPNQPRPATFTAPTQYTAQYQQQFAPQQQQRFSMPPPPQRSYPQQQQPYNLAGIMGTRNLGQQQQMPRPQQQFYQPQPQIPPELQQLREANMRAFQQLPPEQQQMQMTGRSNMNLQDVNTARNALGIGNLSQQYFTPQQYRQDPYMNYVQNQQQAMQQRAMQQTGMQSAQQAEILRQQQAAQRAQSPAAVAQRAAAQGGSYTPEPFVPQ